MKTVNCHRKYPITTNFLDTMLEHSVIIQEGETKLDAYRRGLKELDQIAAELRKEAGQEIRHTIAPANKGWIPGTDFPDYMKTEITFGPLPIISKDKDKLEIDIDNAMCVEELRLLKEAAGKHGLISHYVDRYDLLTTGRPQNFTDGFE